MVNAVKPDKYRFVLTLCDMSPPADSDNIEEEFSDTPQRLYQELRSQRRRQPGQKPFRELGSSE